MTTEKEMSVNIDRPTGQRSSKNIHPEKYFFVACALWLFGLSFRLHFMVTLDFIPFTYKAFRAKNTYSTPVPWTSYTKGQKFFAFHKAFSEK